MSDPITCIFWPSSMNKPSAGFDYATCVAMRQAVLDAITKTLAGGVQEYFIGGRGLKRFTLTELQGLLAFWSNQLQAAMYGGSMIARRVMPTDY